MSNLLLPGDPLFEETLAMPPSAIAQKSFLDGQFVSFVADPETGILRPANFQEMEDYLYGGEWEERMTNLGYDEEDLEMM